MNDNPKTLPGLVWISLTLSPDGACFTHTTPKRTVKSSHSAAAHSPLRARHRPVRPSVAEITELSLIPTHLRSRRGRSLNTRKARSGAGSGWPAARPRSGTPLWRP